MLVLTWLGGLLHRRTGRMIGQSAGVALAVLMLAIPIQIVAVPDWTLRQIDLKQGIQRANRIDDSRIIRGAQPEPD